MKPGNPVGLVMLPPPSPPQSINLITPLQICSFFLSENRKQHDQAQVVFFEKFTSAYLHQIARKIMSLLVKN